MCANIGYKEIYSRVEEKRLFLKITPLPLWFRPTGIRLGWIYFYIVRRLKILKKKLGNFTKNKEHFRTRFVFLSAGWFTGRWRIRLKFVTSFPNKYHQLLPPCLYVYVCSIHKLKTSWRIWSHFFYVWNYPCKTRLGIIQRGN